MRIAAMAAVLAVSALCACAPRPAEKQAAADTATPAAAAAPTSSLTCKGDHTLSCSGAGCESKPDDFLQVELTIAPDTGTGSLCTFTFCRGVSLVRAPGGADPLSGQLISAASGSTEPEASRPNMDYALTIAPDRKTFALMSFGEGRFSGYGGACAPSPTE